MVNRRICRDRGLNWREVWQANEFTFGEVTQAPGSVLMCDSYITTSETESGARRRSMGDRIHLGPVRGPLAPHVETHPWGCHNPRIPDRLVFDKLVAKLVFGGSHAKRADQSCSATTMRARRDEWISAGVFERLEQIVLTTYDRVVGLDLADITVDGQITKAPCGGESTGKSPVDRESSESSGPG